MSRGETPLNADANHVFMTGDAVEVFRGAVELGAGEMVPVS